MPVELIVVHVPKTAGASLSIALRAAYGERALCNPWDRTGTRPEYRPEFVNNLGDWKPLWDEAVQKTPATARVLMGHAPVQLYAHLFHGVPRITMLREPVARVISEYHHFARKRLIPPTMSLLEYARMSEKRNIQTIYTDGGRLEHFNFVGITGMFDVSLRTLGKLLDWNIEYPVAHSNHNVYAGVSPAEREEIFVLNRSDVALYMQALARFFNAVT